MDLLGSGGGIAALLADHEHQRALLPLEGVSLMVLPRELANVVDICMVFGSAPLAKELGLAFVTERVLLVSSLPPESALFLEGQQGLFLFEVGEAIGVAVLQVVLDDVVHRRVVQVQVQCYLPNRLGMVLVPIDDIDTLPVQNESLGRLLALGGLGRRFGLLFGGRSSGT